jgi:hypothetical protein
VTAKIIPLRAISLDSLAVAIRHADAWQAHAQRLAIMLELATAQRDASDLLLRLAEEELIRLRGIIEQHTASTAANPDLLK